MSIALNIAQTRYLYRLSLYLVSIVVCACINKERPIGQKNVSGICTTQASKATSRH